jgi:hypothetical protein
VGRRLEEPFFKTLPLRGSNLRLPPVIAFLLRCKTVASFCLENLIARIPVFLGYFVGRDIKVEGSLDSNTIAPSSLRGVLFLRGLWWKLSD